MARRGAASRAGGFSLVELLVAMTLGLILISSVVAVFAGNRRSAELNAAMADLQEGARFALNAIARDVRMSGFQGCLDVNSGTVTIRANDAPTTNLRATSTSGSVVTSATDWNPDPLPGFTEPTTNPAIAGTHTLQVQFGSAETSLLAAQMVDGAGFASPSGPLVLAQDIGLAAGDLAIVANCDVGDLFTVTEVSANGLSVKHAASANSSGNLTRSYGDAQTIDQTRVMGLSSNVYYVGDTGETNDSGDPIHALYRQSLPYGDPANPPVELIDGVENLRIAFGIRQADDSLRYVAADDALYDPARVESLRVGILMSSWEAIANDEDSNTYTLAGQAIVASDDTSVVDRHPRDRRLRLAFNTTIKVRNRRED